MYNDFEKELGNYMNAQDEKTKLIAQVRGGLYMGLWYGTLFVLIEGWQELKIEDEKINTLFESINLSLLRRYRNGIFHFQKDYFDDRLQDFYKETSTVNWVREVHSEFNRFFLEKIRKSELKFESK